MAGRPTPRQPLRHGSGRGGTGRAETPLERWDRNFGELLQELRVAQTGVQILFAFLLTLPFTERFSRVSAFDRATYVVTIVAAATATALLIAPVSFHRIVFRQGRKPQLVTIASRLAGLGLVCLLVAMLGAVFLAVDVVLHTPVAAAVVAGLAGLYFVLWYGLPLLNRYRS
jgi:hypothetical protein